MALPLQDSVLTVLTEPQAETSNTIEQVRYACSLGALTSVLAIPGATPITHCGPGCAAKQFGSLATINGYQGGDFYVASTNLTSEEVVFGGTERLDELVDATRKIMTSDLYVVLTGCVPELVGDYVDHVVSKYRNSAFRLFLPRPAASRATTSQGMNWWHAPLSINMSAIMKGRARRAR